MSERLFACDPTDRERAKIRTTNQRAQGALFMVDDGPGPYECPACGGKGEQCTCSETGAEAVSLF